MRTSLYIAAMGMLPSFVLGQANYEFRHFKAESGKNAVSSNYINATAQTGLGYLIVGNKGNLQRFNGRDFIDFEGPDSTHVSNVTTLSSGLGYIWYGGFNGMLGIVDDARYRMLDTLLEGNVQSIIANEGEVWVFTKNGEYLHIAGKDTIAGLLDGPERLITCAAQTGRYEFLVGTNEGLFLIRFNSDSKNTLYKPVSELPSSKITSLNYTFNRKELWVGTEDAGMYILLGAGGASFNIRPIAPNGVTLNNVRCLTQDRQGRIWLGSESQGLLRIERHANGSPDHYTTQTFDAFIRPDQAISSIIEDNEGNLWIGQFGGGLTQIIEKVFYEPFNPDWVKQRTINILSHDDAGNIWLGIDRGVFMADMSINPPNYNYFHVDGSAVTSIVQDRAKCVWLGTPRNGVYKKCPSDKDFKRVNLGGDQLVNSINSLTENGDGILASTKGGLYGIDNSGAINLKLTTMEGLPHNNIKHCSIDRNGRLWVANGSNRISYYKNGQVYFLEQGVDQRIVDASYVLEDRNGKIWVGTLGSGIYVLNEGTATNLGLEAGLPSLYCYQLLLDDDGHVWVSHQNMISQISPELKVVRTVASKDVAPVDNTVITSLFKDAEGNIWISSTHGIVKYSPRVDRTRMTKPRVAISSMRVFNVSMNMVDGMELPYNRYSIHFDLAAISLRDPDRIRFKYFLEGFSTQWSEVITEASIYFPRLEDGTYTLKVIAAKEDGEWSDEPAKFTFTVKRPYWRSPWFYVIALASLAAGVLAFIRYRTIKLVNDKLELERIIDQRTSEIQHQKAQIEENRDEIARYAKDITDSIKYAKRLQRAIFPAVVEIKKILPDSFIFFRSKGIVSGDFYFIEQVGDRAIFSAIDCTGHGVPGGFMSIVANNLLSQAVKSKGLTKPSDILDYLNKGVSDTLHQTYEESTVKDGMDIALCAWDKKKNTLEFAGAFNPMYLFRDGQLTVLRGDRMPVGTFVGEEVINFNNFEMPAKEGDVVYIFSDGFADQFGGPDGKKYKLKRFRDLLERIHTLPMDEQYETIFQELAEWQGDHEQVDDIMILGIRIHTT